MLNVIKKNTIIEKKITPFGQQTQRGQYRIEHGEFLSARMSEQPNNHSNERLNERPRKCTSLLGSSPLGPSPSAPLIGGYSPVFCRTLSPSGPLPCFNSSMKKVGRGQ